MHEQQGQHNIGWEVKKKKFECVCSTARQCKKLHKWTNIFMKFFSSFLFKRQEQWFLGNLCKIYCSVLNNNRFICHMCVPSMVYWVIDNRVKHICIQKFETLQQQRKNPTIKLNSISNFKQLSITSRISRREKKSHSSILISFSLLVATAWRHLEAISVDG